MPETGSVSAVAQEARRLSQKRITSLRQRAEKAEAERDEALREGNQWKTAAKREHSRAEEALAQVAVLVDAANRVWEQMGSGESCPGEEIGNACDAANPCAYCSTPAVLSNLPAAAKNLIDEANLFRGLGDQAMAENARLREAAETSCGVLEALSQRVFNRSEGGTADNANYQWAIDHLKAALSPEKP